MIAMACKLELAAWVLSLVKVGQGATATAMRKLSADAGEKMLAEDLAFGDDGVQRRGLAQCPAGMSSCGDEGAPNMCCQTGTYCTRLADAASRVACCPEGKRCGGAVGSCPRGAASCAASLGAGCCIPGYRCEGTSCVPNATTTTATATTPADPETLTSTQTTTVRGTPSTVIVPLTITRTWTPAASSTTQTTTDIVTASSTPAATGSAPWRPTGAPSTPSRQPGCPTGFYGCLATHGGGCCRTGRNCETDSCPPGPGSKTVNSSGPTIVVPDQEPTSTAPRCADGWFLCPGGPDHGCCPHGYDCGSASCHATAPSQTSSVDKQQPDRSAAAVPLALSLCWTAVACAAVGAYVFPWA
ncbi:hypothetical protein CDD82_3424 [Ophiocordyceps australis]|uniref:Granulins domain-containing protein n=1 Tax=Ophiocordyceps australis TaxID=1399860 RepID=A0A2C5ZUU5_9HYPO|nr:hypothetical protein CDD82_3424 [Ophiocordyceps australis]